MDANITSKRQVTIPLQIGIKFGLKPGTVVEFIADGRRVLLVPKRPNRSLAEEGLQRATGTVTGRTSAEAMRLTRGED